MARIFYSRSVVDNSKKRGLSAESPRWSQVLNLIIMMDGTGGPMVGSVDVTAIPDFVNTYIKYVLSN